MRAFVKPAMALSAVAIAAVALAGCSGSGSSGSSDSGGGLTIGFINGSTDDFGVCLQNGVQETADAAGDTVKVLNSNHDAAEEVSNVQDMIDQGVDVIILQSIDSDSLGTAVTDAADAGIPLFITSSVPDDPSAVLGVATSDIAGIGADAGGFVADDAAGAAVTVGIVAGAPGYYSDTEVGGFTGALPSTATVVSTQPNYTFDQAGAQSAAATILQTNPDVDYIFALTEVMAAGVATAVADAGSDAKIVTVNGTDDGLAAVEDGTYAATVSNSAYELGQIAVTNSIALLADPSDSSIDHIATVPYLLITKDNIADATPYCSAAS
ncbi:MAG: sugar ABC transporter substrate-binding protein [Microbacterium sp.]|uniref:sugar ABC transporter substrate-binding protein n=1 Tax=Microbacterium sp. TaxID=51671 RepID=UPI0039E63A3C